MEDDSSGRSTPKNDSRSISTMGIPARTSVNRLGQHLRRTLLARRGTDVALLSLQGWGRDLLGESRIRLSHRTTLRWRGVGD